MSDLNINSNRPQTGGVSHGETIVIRKGGHRASVTDEIVKASAEADVKVPPAEYPNLEIPNYSAKSTVPPQKSANPQTLFGQNFASALDKADFSGEDLGGLSPQEAKNMMAYALTHPGVKLDPNVTQLMNKLIDQANQQTRESTGDANFTYKAPAATPEKASQEFSQNFDDLLKDSKLSDSDKQALTYTHYNPWNSSALKDSLRQTFNSLTQQAQTETTSDLGLTSDQELTADNQAYSQELNQAYEDAFKEALKTVKDDRTRAAVNTLFYHPGADVQNEALAKQTLATLQQQAAGHVAKQFNLPPGVILKPDGAAFNAQFQDTMNKTFNELTSTGMLFGTAGTKDVKFASQDQELIMKYGKQIQGLGMGPQTNLQPPELQRAFDLVRNATIGQMKLQFGLPLDWTPENNTLDKVADEGENEIATGDMQGTDETKEAWDSAAISDRKVNLVTAGIHMSGIDETSAPRDIGLAQDFLDYTRDQVSGITSFAKSYLVGADKISILDAMLAVSAGLTHLRETLYTVEVREMAATKAMSQIQQNIQQDKTRLDEIARKKAEDKAKKKEFAVFKILKMILPGVGKLLVEYIKFFIWTVDIITGGCVSMIAEAAGLKPLTNNPLLAMGIISKEQAKTMDMVLQIIAMVVEIAISILTAQPQLVAMLTARIVSMAAEVGGKVAMQVGIKVAQEVAQQAVKQMAKTAVTQLTREGAEQLVKESVEQVMKQSLKETGEIMTKTGSQKGIKAFRFVEEAGEKWVEQQAKAIAKQAVDDALNKTLKGTTDEVLQGSLKEAAKTAAKSAARETGESAVQQAAKQNAEALGKLSKKMAEEYENGIRELVKAARKAAGKQALGSVLPNLMLVNDIIAGLSQVTNEVIQIPLKLKQAKKVRELAKLKAASTVMNANLEEAKKVSTFLLDGISEIGKWIDQINKQQSGYWQKAQIHFIVA